MHLVKVQHIFIGWRNTLCRADTGGNENGLLRTGTDFYGQIALGIV